MIELFNSYVRDVVTKKIIVGEKISLAVERHLKDLERRDIYFDETEAEIALTFLSMCRHTKGEHARKPFRILPHQAFIVGSIFGWQKNGRRRFRKAYVRMSRKGGKSELAATIALYMLLGVGEHGAEVYSAATTRDQARKVFDAAATMAKMLKNDDDELRKSLKVFTSKNNCLISFEAGGIESIFKPISQDYDYEEGTNPSCAIIDEYHLHKDNGVIEMIETGMGARSNPLEFIITTSGFNTATPCYEYDQIAVNALKGDVDLDDTFIAIFDLDEGDDWEEERVWVKSNPGLPWGLPQLEYLRSLYQRAKVEGMSSERAFRVKNLNQWWNESIGWITYDEWKKGSERIKPEEIEGRSCFAGIDLAANADITALCLLFPPDEPDGKYIVIFKYYVPDAMVKNPLKNEGHVTYQRWAKEGYLTVTDGNVTDYDYIESDILKLNEVFDIQVIGYDRARAYSLMSKLTEHGFKVEPVPQTHLGQSAPLNQIERLVYSGKLKHGGNPVTDWMLGNVAIMTDSNENIKLDRKKKKGKIDGIAAMMDAFHVYLKSIGQGQDVTIDDLLNSKMIVI